MHLPGKEERLFRAQVPSPAGRHHVPVFPEIYGSVEHGPVRRGLVVQDLCPDEDAVGVHVHVVDEREYLRPRIVSAFGAFDYLPFAVAHGASFRECRDGVPGVVVEEMGAEGVVLAVFKLDYAAAALHKVFLHQVIHLLAGEDGLVLHHLHVAPGVDDLLVHMPDGRIADKVCAVVHEGGVDGAPRGVPVHFHQLQFPGLDEAHEAVLLPAVLGRSRRAGQHQGRQQDYFLTFEAHPLREKSQLPKRGSMIM